jgi:hypothetical protein
MKTITKIIYLAFVMLALVCFGLSPTARAATPGAIPEITPTPDGCYPGFNTAEGCNALLNINTASGQGNTALGFAALKFLTTGDNNTAVGVNTMLLTTTGIQNTAVGQGALANNNANNNVAAGYQALKSNTIGFGNTATGSQALLLNTRGNANTANGFQALKSNTAGIGNTANGDAALFLNTTGNENTANGVLALFVNTTGGFNTATGSSALENNGTGFNNTATGVFALANNTTGDGNTADGVNALLNNTTGINNVALGVQAGVNLTTGNNNIDIGNFGVAAESATIRIGLGQTRTFIAGIRGRTTGVANALPVVIDSNWQLGTASSSRRFKKEIKPMNQTSESILGLKPVTFHYKSDATNTPQFGLIAEEVEKVNPDLVVRDENGEIYTVRYDAVNAMLLNEFLKEHSKVEQLGKQVEALAAGLEKVSAQLELSKAAQQVAAENP